MKALHLQPGRERRILQGHRWIFSNEISEKLTDYTPGDWVEVFTGKGVPLGVGYINPQSLIAVRLVGPPGQEPTRDFLLQLAQKAAARRTNLLCPDASCYRAVYGESDGLPGLVVDRYGEILVYQITTLGMSHLEPLLQEILLEVFHPREIGRAHV